MSYYKTQILEPLPETNGFHLLCTNYWESLDKARADFNQVTQEWSVRFRIELRSPTDELLKVRLEPRSN